MSGSDRRALLGLLVDVESGVGDVRASKSISSSRNGRDEGNLIASAHRIVELRIGAVDRESQAGSIGTEPRVTFQDPLEYLTCGACFAEGELHFGRADDLARSSEGEDSNRTS
jgi:hypothetical protein